MQNRQSVHLKARVVVRGEGIGATIPQSCDR